MANWIILWFTEQWLAKFEVKEGNGCQRTKTFMNWDKLIFENWDILSNNELIKSLKDKSFDWKYVYYFI